jgi:cytochrome oxidase Cu insertion factor (SCO1/SenC/PrrC family)
MSPRRKNILTLLAIISPFVLFSIAGHYFINPWELPRVNKGQLIIPHIPIAGLSLKDAEGGAYNAEDTSGSWTLLYIAGPHCDTACKNGLYYQMRQVRLTLNDNARRVRRLVVLTAEPDADLRAFLDNNVAGMEQAHGELIALRGALEPVYDPDPSTPLGDVFVVSPDGQIFLRYPTHESMDATLEEAENIRLDLERTLKGSLI